MANTQNFVLRTKPDQQELGTAPNKGARYRFLSQCHSSAARL